MRIDSKAVGKAPWEGRLPLGEHVIEVSAGGFFPANRTVRLERRKQRELSVSLERRPDPVAEARAAMNRKIGVVLAYGVGAAGLGVFGVAGALALDKVKELDARCPDKQCPSTQEGERRAAAALGTTATVGLVVGGSGWRRGRPCCCSRVPEAMSGAPARA
ncbi:PEGA domain-containing protein [Sorangium sp. So ce341]|uniref:PEGA domain-containing protein n=1 Tax=Sorangium sp. So ce341 TaxID=3133302 RepID=UPI003F5FCB43